MFLTDHPRHLRRWRCTPCRSRGRSRSLAGLLASSLAMLPNNFVSASSLVAAMLASPGLRKLRCLS